MRILTAALLLVASSSFAADPPSPLDPGKEWGEPTYEKVPEHEYDKEYWNYASEFATLHIIKHRCSVCGPLGDDIPNGIVSSVPTDVTAVVAAGHNRGILTLSIEPEHHIAFGYVTTSDRHAYAIDLVMLDGIPARESMRLQQGVLKMFSGWEPK